MTLRQKKTDWKGLNIIDELNTYQKQIDSKVMEKKDFLDNLRVERQRNI